ncbi:hypothetical protein ACFQU7_28340 [Pseudoroseomonas wenyumeiae]
MGQAYLMVVVFYVLGMLLTLGVDATRAADRETMGAAPSPLRGLWRRRKQCGRRRRSWRRC